MAHDSKEAGQMASFGAFIRFRPGDSLYAEVRRSFSNFARGWPGIGLLVIRSLIGLTVINHEARMLLRHPLGFSSAVSLALVIAGILLIIGLWTPVAGVLVGVLQVLNFLHGSDPWMFVRLGIFASALAMVGPGAWSVDARLFGWKRLEVPPRGTNRPRNGSSNDSKEAYHLSSE
jgi:uncharacterized membrane protein YphA (DoxX/SURF4 family)